jgi:DNA sulfur modification protein DndC
MGKASSGRGRSAFAESGLENTIEGLLAEVMSLYMEDEIPWVIGYSGGKDSTAVLQLVWQALQQLDEDDLFKPVHVISTDTLVENPIVARWVTGSLTTLQEAATAQGLPITTHRLTPKLEESFWVNLIGKGYPAPRHKFRWCTERMKIKPSNTFITDVVRANGEAILVLGTRKAESSKRHARMKKLEKQRMRDRLSPNQALPNCLVYSPIEEWSNDDVWLYLMQVDNPWGHDNHQLLSMYQGASADGECPLVVDTTTPSCGSSRFGCWVCTLVDQDRSMAAMIQNDEEKEWMLPLFELRNELDIGDDRHLRDFRRMSGRVEVMNDGQGGKKTIPGPYTQQARADWLSKLLEAQRWITENAPESMQDLEVISLDELEEIRRIWVFEKHELEDQLPRVYKETMGEPYPGAPVDDDLPFRLDDLKELQGVCGEDRLQYELARELLDVERQFSGRARRSGLYGALEHAFARHGYESEEEAVTLAQRKSRAIQDAREGRYRQMSMFPDGSGAEPQAEGH